LRLYYITLKNQSNIKKTIGLFVLASAILILFLGLKSGKQEDAKCAIWSPSYSGAYYRYCMFADASKYYDELHWYNSNNHRVYVTWTWSVKNEYKSSSAVYLDPEEKNSSAIPEGYKIISVTVEPK
jgi:hypothetical protein